jgi:hypothetical protein
LTAVPPLEAAKLTVRRRIIIGLWVAVVLAVGINAKFGDSGWDMQVYVTAIHSLRIGHDPYADAMAVQQAYHEQGGSLSGALPYSYVYSPITLPVLRLVGKLPFWLSGAS